MLIIDGLDRLPPGRDKEFFVHREQICSLRSHLLLTAPISYAYSTENAQWEQTSGCPCVFMPMVSLRKEKGQEAARNSEGAELFQKIIEARCIAAGLKVDEAFESDEVWWYLVEQTGGHPRHLMRFVRDALSEVESLPITMAAAHVAILKYANTLFRQMPDEYWNDLRNYDIPRENLVKKDEVNMDMLFSLYVFEYMNGKTWFEVNPVFRTLDRFKAE